MNHLTLGLIAGLIFGFLDGISAVFNPSAQSMLGVIVASATIKGAMTGGAVGLLAKRIRGVCRNVAAGAAVGAVLSILAANPSGTYLPIIAPGVAIGGLIGAVVSKWGRKPDSI